MASIHNGNHLLIFTVATLIVEVVLVKQLLICTAT